MRDVGRRTTMCLWSLSARASARSRPRGGSSGVDGRIALTLVLAVTAAVEASI
jgi:hypothetical protein